MSKPSYAEPDRTYAPFDRNAVLATLTDEELIDILEIALVATKPYDRINDNFYVLWTREHVGGMCDLSDEALDALHNKLDQVMNNYLEGEDNQA